MNTISREELKGKIDRGEDFKLCCTLGKLQFDAMHIPGSIHVDSPEKAMAHLQLKDDIIVYCSDIDCSASRLAYRLLLENGYKNVRRYEGGLADWQEADYPMSGHMA